MYQNLPYNFNQNLLINQNFNHLFKHLIIAHRKIFKNLIIIILIIIIIIILILMVIWRMVTQHLKQPNGLVGGKIFKIKIMIRGIFMNKNFLIMFFKDF